jgi:curved DNA-binding protein CbpA
MANPDPFSVLEIAPTLDAAQVKRAYFAKLQKHPPHADPEGFRRLRTAYEALTAPGALALAFIVAPFDSSAELEAWHRQWSVSLHRAADRVRQVHLDCQAIDSFVARVSRVGLDEAVAMFGETKS